MYKNLVLYREVNFSIENAAEIVLNRTLDCENDINSLSISILPSALLLKNRKLSPRPVVELSGTILAAQLITPVRLTVIR
jgi:hypothetical protein